MKGAIRPLDVDRDVYLSFVYLYILEKDWRYISDMFSTDTKKLYCLLFFVLLYTILSTDCCNNVNVTLVGQKSHKPRKT